MRKTKKNINEITHTFRHVSISAFLLILFLPVISGCSDEKGPTVPALTMTPEEVTVSRNQEIKIGMLSITPAPKLFFSISRGTYDIYLGEETAASHSGFADQVWRVEVKDEKFLKLVNPSGKEFDFPQEVIYIKPAGDMVEDGQILIGETKTKLRPYRGYFKIAIENKHSLAINVVPIEEYLLGVVPAEMPSSWPEDALKAQAVAARSYAYYNIGRFGYRGFDLADTVVSQAYAGKFAETEATTKAVVDTEGEVLIYKDNITNCLYSSTCGGRSASSAEIFNPNHLVPYLVSKDDSSPWGYYCEESPLYRWERTYSRDVIEETLGKSVHTDPGEKMSSITIASRTPSDWVERIYISGERDHLATAAEFRAALNVYLEKNAIPSTNFELDYADGEYHFSGKGFGHGVGLCQWGAKSRAENGIHYDNILMHYYSDCELYELSIAAPFTFYRDDEYFLMNERLRKENEIEGYGAAYLPPEELDEDEVIEENADAETPEEALETGIEEDNPGHNPLDMIS
jgi:stage II sporulation protein D